MYSSGSAAATSTQPGEVPDRWIYALDAQKGCAYWAFKADAAIRSGAAVDSGMVAFGDVRGNVYGLDEETGERWSARVGAGDGGQLVTLVVSRR